MKKIPYRINLSEEYIPKQWYNVRADMKEKPEPLLNPATMKPITKPRNAENNGDAVKMSERHQLSTNAVKKKR